MSDTRRRILDYILLGVALYACWWALSLLVGADALTPPGRTLVRAAEYLGAPSFWRHAQATGVAFAWACLLSLVGGLTIGLAIGVSRLATDVGEPLIGTLYTIPKITLYPVVLLVFGLGLSAKIAFGVLHGIFPVILLTIGAIRNTRQVYLKSARVMKLSRSQTALHVLAPAILPEVVTGLRIGFSSALLGTLVAELFASEEGLGFILIRAMEANKVTDVMALAFLLFAFAASVGGFLLAFEKRFHRA